MGNLVFLLLPPLSAWQFFGAYVLASVFRGVAVGVGVFAVTLLFWVPDSFDLAWILVFTFLGAAMLGVLGLIAGIVSDKFDQMAAFQNFIILPATFLSGVFYSVHTLPPFWQAISRVNPFFYVIDGFRFGFFRASDVSPWTSVSVVFVALLAVSAVALTLLRRGYKLRY
jgi:ABC-2 type transport system permease protein